MTKIISLYILFIINFSCKSQVADQDIVLVNVGNLDRAGIANEIMIINQLNPKVIAIDLEFSKDTEYTKDLRLMQALDNCKNLVMISVIENYTGEDIEYKGFTFGSLPNFLTNAKTGFGNTLLRDEQDILMRFSLWEKVSGRTEYHFSIKTAMAYDSVKSINFVNSRPKIVDVDYKNGTRRFRTFLPSEILNKEINRINIEGKIVMLGFLGPGNEDKFFTPLNKNPNEPDMYGLEYLANIVAQVLESK